MGLQKWNDDYDQNKNTRKHLLYKHAPQKQNKIGSLRIYRGLAQKNTFLKESGTDQSLWWIAQCFVTRLIFLTACYTKANANSTWSWFRSDPTCTPVSVFPNNVSHASLANRLSTCFIYQICNIGSGLPCLTPSAISRKDVSPVSKFQIVSTDDGHNIIMSSPTKSCSLFWSRSRSTWYSNLAHHQYCQFVIIERVSHWQI